MNHIWSKGGEPEFNAILIELVDGIALHKTLADLADSDRDFSTLLEVVNIQVGKSWETQGMPGESGYSLYTNDLKPAKHAA